MSTRTRVCLLVVAVILLGYPLAAWIIGFIVEGQIEAREQQALEQAAPYASIVERSYHRGVYGATEVVTVGLGSPALKALPGVGAFSSLRVTVRNTIHHGPLPRLRALALATVDTELVLPAEAQKRIATLLGGKQLVNVHSTMGWLGGYETDFSSPAFSGEISPNTTLSSGGMVGTTTATRNVASFTSDVTASTFSISANEFQARLDDFRMHAAMRRAFEDMNVGDVSATLGRFEARSKKDDEPDKQALLQQITLTSHSSIAGDYLDMRGNLVAASLQIGKFTATKAGYEVFTSHVYGPAFVSLIHGMRDVGRNVSADTAVAQSQQRLAELFGKDGVELLVHDPVIQITRIGFVTPQGEFNLSTRFAAPGLKREDLAQRGPALIAALVQHLQAKADLRVDTDLLDKLTEGTPGNGDRLAAQVRTFEGQGYIVRDGKALTTHLVFDHGKLSINGKPFPPGPGGPGGPQ